MLNEKFKDNDYTPPELEIFDLEEIFEKFGPVISCSGYGGAVTGC